MFINNSPCSVTLALEQACKPTLGGVGRSGLVPIDQTFAGFGPTNSQWLRTSATNVSFPAARTSKLLRR